MQRPLAWFPIFAVLALAALPLSAFTSSPAANVVLSTMQQELQRATKSLAKTDPAPYYMSYAVTDADETAVVASDGSVIYSASVDRRQADVMMRVGSVALDNTHSQSRGSGITSGLLPLNDDANAHCPRPLAAHRSRIRTSLRGVPEGEDQQCGAIRRGRQVAGFFEGTPAGPSECKAAARWFQPERLGRTYAEHFCGISEISRGVLVIRFVHGFR